MLGRRGAIAAAVVALVSVAGCTGSSHNASPATTSTPAAGTSAPPTASSTPGCISRRDIGKWSVARRAAELTVVPALDFDVAGLAPLFRAGTGGVIFLGNASTPPDLAAQLRAATAGTDATTAPIVMADVEGGGVQRLPGAVDAFPWPREMAATMTTAQVEQLAESVGHQMLDAGVTMDLAPVVDLDDRPGPSATNPDGLRSFGIDPTIAGNYGVAFMQGLRTAGVLPVVKHFPGLGLSLQNTDYGPAATQPISELRTAGLKPFIAAIAAHAPAIMVGNTYVPGVTTEPASVSPAVIEQLLRGQLGFSGLVVTDSLSAGAISQAGYSVPEAAAASIEAGADLVLFGSTLTPAATQLLSPANVAKTRHTIVGSLVERGPLGRVDAGAPRRRRRPRARRQTRRGLRELTRPIWSRRALRQRFFALQILPALMQLFTRCSSSLGTHTLKKSAWPEYWPPDAERDTRTTPRRVVHVDA